MRRPSIDAFLRPPAPPARLTIARVLVGLYGLVYVVARFRYFADLSRHHPTELAPVGVASVLSAPLAPAWTWTIAAATVIAGALFVRGMGLRLSGPAFFAGLLWVTTYRSSFGKILHTENLLVLHVGILAVAPLLGARSDERARGWTLRTMAIATVLTYVVAGIAKLRSGGAAWISGRALGDWLAFDALRKIELGSFHSPLAAPLAGSPALLTGLSLLTLAVELGAPLALAGPRASRAWTALAWSFHFGVLVTMAIGFFYPLSGVAFAALFPLERSRLLCRLTTEGLIVSRELPPR